MGKMSNMFLLGCNVVALLIIIKTHFSFFSYRICNYIFICSYVNYMEKEVEKDELWNVRTWFKDLTNTQFAKKKVLIIDIEKLTWKGSFTYHGLQNNFGWKMKQKPFSEKKLHNLKLLEGKKFVKTSWQIFFPF